MKTFTQTPIKRWLTVAGIALLVPLSAMAYQGHGGKMGGCEAKGGERQGAGMMQHGHSMGMMRGLHRLDLSEAQQDQIFELMHAQAPAMRKQMKTLRQHEAALQTLKKTPDYSEAKAKELIINMTQQRADMEMARLQVERKVMEVLTPEQRQQLTEMKPGKRDGRGPGPKS
jgi:periplasmic protein CpxP/Spy